MAAVTRQTGWLALASTSGACAAFNGVFAKLTTTELTASWAQKLSLAFGIDQSSRFVEYAIRAIFFALNLLFNGIMWGFFTRALTLATSTVRVSIINTSSNFMTTAFLGAIIFKESLRGLWWLGASFLVAGSVIIGRREEDEKAATSTVRGADSLLQVAEEERENEQPRYTDDFRKDDNGGSDSESIELATVADAEDSDK